MKTQIGALVCAALLLSACSDPNKPEPAVGTGASSQGTSAETFAKLPAKPPVKPPIKPPGTTPGSEGNLIPGANCRTKPGGDPARPAETIRECTGVSKHGGAFVFRAVYFGARNAGGSSFIKADASYGPVAGLPNMTVCFAQNVRVDNDSRIDTACTINVAKGETYLFRLRMNYNNANTRLEQMTVCPFQSKDCK